MDSSDDTPSPGSVAVRFAVRSLLVFVLVGVAADLLLLRPGTADDVRESMSFHAEFVVDIVVGPLVEEVVDPDELGAQLESLVRRDKQVVSLAVSGPAGPVSAGTPGADAVVDVVELPGGTRVTVQQDRAVLQRTIAGAVARADIVLLVALLGTWLVLLPLAHRLGTTLARRGEHLAELLGREQESSARLAELVRLRDRFTTAAAHELRTPTTVVAGAVRTLQERGDGLDDDVRQRLLDSASSASVRLSELVEGLTVLQTADVPSALGAVDLRATVLAVVARRGGPAGIEVDVPTMRVLADADVLNKIVDALVANALRHGAPPVVVRADARGDTVRLVVQDAGPGFPDGTWESMFQPFTQGPIDDEHQPGVGIGLATVARRVASLGGRVWAEPVPDGTGACIHVELPEATSRPVEPSRAAPVGSRD